MLVFQEHVSRRQFIVICLIAATDGADMAMMGACFRAFEAEMHIGPMLLSSMAVAQALTGAVAAPVWGLLCDNGLLSRRRLWAGGTFGWGFVMFGLAASSYLPAILMLRLANGFFLASLAPLLQSWVAESTSPKDSGRIFGMVMSACTFGKICCTSAAVTLQGKVWVAGVGLVTGWRVLCTFVGFAAFATSLLTWHCFGLPSEQRRQGRKEGTIEREHRFAAQVSPDMRILGYIVLAFSEMWRNVRDHWRSHTFRVIVAQGVLGGTAFQANAFELMFFMYLGMSPAQLALMASIHVLPDLVSTTSGGMFGDFMERRCAGRGRAYTAQICVAGIISVIFAQYVVFPAFGPLLIPFAICKCILPMFGGMYHPGVLKPLLTEIADPQRRSSIIAWEHALEGTVAACLGSPLVGFLSERVYGYKPSNVEISAMDPSDRKRNLHALQMSIAMMMLIPLSVCFLVNTYLHWAHPRDRAQWAVVAKTEEMQDIKGKTEEQRALE